MNTQPSSEAVRSALDDAAHSILDGTHLDGQHLSAEERARLRATASLQNAFVLSDPHLPDNPIVYANQAFLDLSGYPEEQIVGFNCRFLQGPRTDRAEVARLKEAIQRRRPVQVTLLNYRRDGTTFWNELTVTPVRDERGDLTHFAAVQTDVSALKEAEEALGESERRLRLALTSGGLGTWHLDLVADQLRDVSATWKAHFGLLPDAEVSLHDVFQAIHPDDRAAMRQALQRAVDSRGAMEERHRVVWPDGGVHWVSVSATTSNAASSEAQSIIGVTQDITERVEAEAERERLHRETERLLAEALERADRDPLTGLWNHRAFHRRLEEETARVQREGVPLGVVILDLDNFGFFNNAYGHIVGDEVLRLVAEQLQAVCRPYDTVARFGGDEFALLLPGVGGATACDLEARLRADLSGLSCHPMGTGEAIPITVSVGAALLTGVDMDRLDPLRRADERLLRSKTGGSAETEADQVRAAAGAVAGFSMLDALVTAVDNKDRYTLQHSEGVMDYSLLIARELGLNDGTQQTIAVAALLHDVGKIGVPDAVLRKPGKLTDEEFSAVQQHPTMGAALVSTVAGLEATLDAVRHHHERWDGAGYPSGLRGEETPLMARLMAVADAYSAMTTDRPYRKGMDGEKALSILEDGAGTQWDPECVQAFLNALLHQQSAGVKA